MEKKDHLTKMEDNTGDYSYPFSGMFDFSQGNEKDCSLGFIELLGMHNISSNNSLLFDMPRITIPQFLPTTSTTSFTPATPNSSSFSSASSEAAVNEEPQTNDKVVKNEEEEEDEEDEGDEPEPKKESSKVKPKKKKTSEKKPREPRIAFMTKSEVDYLEDGYRWRKYGQKAVKNTPYPRSYFRCTTTSCNVKKRVERCADNPGVVVTTYEGKHTHQSPHLMPHPPHNSSLRPTTLFPNYQQQLVVPPFAHNQVYNLGFPASDDNKNFLNERRFCSSAASSASLIDHGLLQDIVPSNMWNKASR